MNKINKSKFEEYWNSLGKNCIKDDDMGMVEVYCLGAFNFCKNEVLKIVKNNLSNDKLSRENFIGDFIDIEAYKEIENL